MPDKFTHIDDGFTDQGWSEMKKMLDQELPVRPAPFLWFRKRLLGLLLLLIPLGAAWGFYQFGFLVKTHNAESVKTQPAAIPSPSAKPIATLESIENNASSTVASAKVEQDLASRIPNPAPSAVASAKAAQDLASRIPNPAPSAVASAKVEQDLASRIPNPAPSAVASAKAAQDLASRIPNPAPSAVASAKAAQDLASRIPNPAPSAVASAKAAQDLASRIPNPAPSAVASAKVEQDLASRIPNPAPVTPKLYSSIPPLPSPFAAPQIETAIPLIEVHKPAPTQKAWAVGLEAGAFTNAGLNSVGYTGGLRIERALGQSAWGIQTGLGYTQYTRPFEAQLLRGNVALEDLENQAEPLFDTLEDVNLSVEHAAYSTNSVISRLHFLDIPLVVTYQPNERWQLFGGGGIGLLLASQTDAGTRGGSGLFKVSAESFDSNPIQTNAPSNVNPKVHLLNPYLEGGLTYFPTKRFGISGQFNVGLRDLLSNWPGDQHLHKVQLKISYWFR